MSRCFIRSFGRSSSDARTDEIKRGISKSRGASAKERGCARVVRAKKAELAGVADAADATGGEEWCGR